MISNPQMDWRQVVLNGGPPCFAQLEDEKGYYCGRVQRWEGHDGEHEFISLNDLLTTVRREALEQACRVICPRCSLPEYFMPAERISNSKRWWHREVNKSFEDGFTTQCDGWTIRNLMLEAAANSVQDESEADQVVEKQEQGK